MMSLVEGKLDKDQFPYVTPPPQGKEAAASGASLLGQSVRSRPRANRFELPSSDADAEEASAREVPKFVVFVVGGACHAELAAAYNVAKLSGSSVAIGTTDVVSPVRFLRSIEHLCDEEPPPLLAPPPLTEESNRSKGGGEAQARIV
mmetsp:Transcript_48088/g.120224  ORF Transcript_48088/g.120224 Transcript_48088/m.120224 type:complete len:147 (+) Transcript_48088:101-541(+)